MCYTRSGNQWLFRDSTANRLCESFSTTDYYFPLTNDVYNIPKVVDVTQELQEWVCSSKNLSRLRDAPAKNIPEYVHQFTQNILHVCVRMLILATGLALW